MNGPDRSDLDQLARALAALLAAWWMNYGRNHDMTMDKARAPPQDATTVWSSVRRQNTNKTRK
jgi:hypothetical protein